MNTKEQSQIQKYFNPIDYFFSWTKDGWYTWEASLARKEAMKKRNEYAKELKSQGYKVVKSSLRDQLITRGGIGSGNPQVEFVVNCYGLYALK